MATPAPTRTTKDWSKEPARYPLIALSAACCVAIITGTFTYSYPETLASIRPPLILVHELSGDVMIVSAVAYIVIHLRRTWKLRKLALSWWTGIGIATLLAVASASGVYGQLLALETDSPLYWLHVITSVALVAGACFHGAYGLRRRLR